MDDDTIHEKPQVRSDARHGGFTVQDAGDAEEKRISLSAPPSCLLTRGAAPYDRSHPQPSAPARPGALRRLGPDDVAKIEVGVAEHVFSETRAANSIIRITTRAGAAKR